MVMRYEDLRVKSVSLCVYEWFTVEDEYKEITMEDLNFERVFLKNIRIVFKYSEWIVRTGVSDKR